ncbi:hypothetical protein GCM10028805_21680 [Spirosoma harenae]
MREYVINANKLFANLSSARDYERFRFNRFYNGEHHYYTSPEFIHAAQYKTGIQKRNSVDGWQAGQKLLAE